MVLNGRDGGVVAEDGERDTVCVRERETKGRGDTE